jgi:hypothetical protein
MADEHDTGAATIVGPLRGDPPDEVTTVCDALHVDVELLIQHEAIVGATGVARESCDGSDYCESS